MVGSLEEKGMVRRVRMSLRISAAECPASANSDEEWNNTPAVAFIQTRPKLTNLSTNSISTCTESERGGTIRFELFVRQDWKYLLMLIMLNHENDHVHDDGPCVSV